MAGEKKLLFLHQNGQWAKKIKGKLYYFGTDYDEAVNEYLKDHDHLHAGRGKQRSGGSPSLAGLANVYFDGCRDRVSLGEMQPRTLKTIEDSLDLLIAIRGKDDRPGAWGPLDFREIRLELFDPIEREYRGGKSVTRRAATTVDGDIRRIKAFLNWCYKSELIPAPKYGQEFSESPARQRRLVKSAMGKRVLDRETLAEIMAQCKPNFLPVVLLGINGGMGARDIAGLTISQVEGQEWLDCPRQKTGIERRIWLWPETREAINHYLGELRNPPWLDVYDDVAFLTIKRTPWVTDKKDAASFAFYQARKAAGLASGSFYDLRRTFQSVADESLDFPAVSHVMGHVPSSGDMAAVYREITDERIRRVCELVRGRMVG